jgi:hypothetical protein
MTIKQADTILNRSQSFSSSQKKTIRDAIDELVDYGGWRDLTMPTVSAVVGAGTPSLAVFGPSGNIKQYKMAIGDSVYMTAHVDHDWLVGSNAFFHVHWSPSGTNAQPVWWEVNYTIAKGHQQAAFPAEDQIILKQTPEGTAWTHQIVEDTAGFSLVETDSLLLFEVKRITNGATDNTDDIFLLTCDLHYQVGQAATVSRSPDFFVKKANE